MNPSEMDNNNEKLSALLKKERPLIEASPGFERQVWQKIEQSEENPTGVFELVSRWLVTPRIAWGALACLVLLSSAFGVSRGMRVGEKEARERYLAIVNPAHLETQELGR